MRLIAYCESMEFIYNMRIFSLEIHLELGV